MNKKTKGLVAGAAGAALLMGGATFALWSDSEGVAGGTITAGNLDVGEVSQAWHDVSEDRTDRGHEIDLDEFRTIPGDTVQGTFTIPVTLEGENMVAELALDGLKDPKGDLVEGLDIVDVAVSVGDEPIDVTGDSILFASEDNGNNEDAELPIVPAGGADIDVVLTVAFDGDISGQDLVDATAKLKDFEVSLTQFRADDAPGQGGYQN